MSAARASAVVTAATTALTTASSRASSTGRPRPAWRKYSRQNAKISLDMSHALLAFFAAVILLRIIAYSTYKWGSKLLRFFDGPVSRRVRKHILEPPLIRRSHSNPYNLFGKLPMLLPTRAESLIVLGYCVVNVVILCIKYPIHFPNARYPTKTMQIQAYLAVRTGFTAMAPLPLIYLFGGRNNFLMWVTGWPMSTFNVFHKWLGRIMFINLVAHAVAFTMIRITLGSYARSWHKLYWHHGMVTAIAGGIIVFQSVKYLRGRWYEIFLVLHLLMVIAFTVGAYYHIKILSDIEYLYATIAVWVFDRILRLVRIWITAKNKVDWTCSTDLQLFGLTSSQGEVFSRCVVEYSGSWSPFAGRHVYLYFLHDPKFAWQSHPFTLTPYLDENYNVSPNKFVILMRMKDGITKKLCDYAVSQVSTELEKKDTVHTVPLKMLVEGPYGSRHNLKPYQDISVFAGGVGITAVFGYIVELLQSNDALSRIIRLTWIVRHARILDAYTPEIEYLSRQGPNVQVRIYVVSDSRTVSNEDLPITDSKNEEKLAQVSIAYDQTNSSQNTGLNSSDSRTDFSRFMEAGRPNAGELTKRMLSQAQGDAAVMVCGPGGLNDDVRRAVVDSLIKFPHRLDFFEESYMW